jgi:virginiamycin B lyase
LPDAKAQDKVVPIASIWDLKFDESGNLWFPDVVANAIWKFNPARETFEVFKIPTTTEFRTSYPINFSFDDDGNIWFSEIYGKKIGFIDPSNVQHDTSEGIREFSASVDLETIGPLTFDNNGNIWFTALTYPVNGKIMKFDPASKSFATYDLPQGISSPVGIVTDKDGNLWIGDHGTSSFVKFNPDTGSVVTYATSLPHASTSLKLYDDCLTQPEGSSFTCGGLPVSLPYWNEIDDKGKIWFNLHQGNSIGVLDPEAATIIEYFVPSQNPRWGSCEGYDEPCGIANPLQFTIASDGKIWFTEWSENKIAVLNPNLPLPLKLDVTNNDVTVSHGESVKIDLQVTANKKLDNDVEMRISGTIVPTGRLFNLTAQFSEHRLTFEEPSTKPVTLTLEPQAGLQASEYRITVSAKYNEVTYSKIVRLVVEPSKI